MKNNCNKNLKYHGYTSHIILTILSIFALLLSVSAASSSVLVFILSQGHSFNLYVHTKMLVTVPLYTMAFIITMFSLLLTYNKSQKVQFSYMPFNLSVTAIIITIMTFVFFIIIDILFLMISKAV